MGTHECLRNPGIHSPLAPQPAWAGGRFGSGQPGMPQTGLDKCP